MDDLPNLVENTSITPVSFPEASSAAGRVNGCCAAETPDNCNGALSDDSFADEDDDLILLDDNDDARDVMVQFAGCQITECLVCTDTTESPEQMLSHMMQKHNFDLIKTCLYYKLDHVMYIKLINFMRSNKSLFDDIKSNNFDVSQLTDCHMIPIYQDDAFLRFGK